MAYYWVIGVVLCVLAAGFAVDIWLVFRYERAEDSNYVQGLLGKIVTLFGLELVWMLVMGLPTDAFTAYNGGSIDMYIYWSTFTLFLIIFVAVPLPFAVHMYRTDSDPRSHKMPGWKAGLCWTSIYVCVAALVFGVGYAVLGKHANIPTEVIQCFQLDPENYPPLTDPAEANTPKGGCLKDYKAYTDSTQAKVDISFVVFSCGLLSFFGYWFFVVYGAVGLVAVPFDLISGFIHRPKPINLDTFKADKRGLGDKATALKTHGQKMKDQEILLRDDRGMSAMRKKFMLHAELRKFRQTVYLLEQTYNNLTISLKNRGENPVLSYTKLSLGIFSAILSCALLVHTIIFTGVALYSQNVPGTLDSLLLALQKVNTYFLDSLFYCTFTLYWVVCTVWGSFKFTMRVFWFSKIHPIRKRDTRLDSILYNVFILSAAEAALMQFSFVSSCL
eukprot:Lankesteria_metandrocarpae@DN5294_c0_g1_i2.p1